MIDLTKELAETLKELRTKFDARQHLSPSMVRVDAALELYEDACKTPEETKMTINLKDYANKLVVVTLRNKWMVVSLVNTSGKYNNVPYFIDGRYYISDGRCFYPANREHDIVDIVLADEDPCETPKPSMTNCFIEGNPPNGCPAWSVWYEEFGSRGILNNLKISSVDYKPIPQPEPVITRVEVITHKREYVNWNPDNKITTSLQDDGKTLKVFVTQNTEEPKMPITKPHYDSLTPGNKTMYEIAEKEVSKQWATALSDFIDKLGGDSPAFWEWNGITPTPEKVVECLREHIQYLQQLAADNELDECCELISKRYSGCTYERQDTAKVISIWMRNTRRPKPTLKSQALKDFETVRKHSDLLPEILDTIENALKSLPE
jgi:hypothetical protein